MGKWGTRWGRAKKWSGGYVLDTVSVISIARSQSTR